MRWDGLLRRARALNARQIPDTVACILLMLLAIACAFFLLAQPRRVDPVQLPSLRLPADEISAAVERDRKASRALVVSEAVTKLEKTFLQKGEAANDPSASPGRSEGLRRTLRDGLEALARNLGEKAVVGLRARAVARLESALDLGLSEKETRGVLGSFPVLLQRYDAARNGELLAPLFVVRTMYKSQWNLIHGLDSTEGFTRVEEAALYGWLALHGQSAPLTLRLRALEAFASAGGLQIAEARGVLYFKLGRYREAEQELVSAIDRNPSIRLRNYWLGARRAVETATATP
jgi:hypothetical protein